MLLWVGDEVLRELFVCLESKESLLINELSLVSLSVIGSAHGCCSPEHIIAYRPVVIM